MKPDDSNGQRPAAERPYRALIVAGSNRRQYNCPSVDSKARALMLRMAERLPQAWEIDYEDLGNIFARARIQSCNACASTSMALCVWPCNCYQPGDKNEPDLMWDLRMYERLDLADAWAIIGPVNWYGPTSNLKLMFDRLVCMSGGNPREDLIGHKDPEKAIELEKSPQWSDLSRNHLEGRTAAFFCYSDKGADELGEDGRPKLVKHKAWFDPDDEPHEDERNAYAPLVWQCRYSGIEAPDRLWRNSLTGVGLPYSENQAEDMVREDPFMAAFDSWTDDFAAFVAEKGKVEPGKFRAYGYAAPGHKLADAKSKLREWRMSLGLAPAGSSPAEQEQLGLNQDTGLRATEPEGTKLRRD
jgi:hypothetical protein